MIDVQAARHKIHDHLVALGWTTNITMANYTRPNRRLEFKVGTSYGEVAVHVRDVREVVQTIRILTDEQAEDAMVQIEDLALESNLNAMAQGAK